MTDRYRELSELLAALCDQRLEAEDCARLEAIVRSDREALRFYLQYVQLHGLLHWDAANGDVAVDAVDGEANGVATALTGGGGAVLPAPMSTPDERPRRRWAGRYRIALAACVCLGLAWFSLKGFRADRADLAQDQPRPQPVEPVSPEASDTNTRPSHPGNVVRLSPPAGGSGTVRTPDAIERASVPTPPAAIADANHEHRSSASPIALIDQQVAAYWQEHEVTPAPRASDAEWLRRVYLDVAGRIPDADAAATFLADTRPDKRERLLDDLLAGPEFARHYSVVWTNLLIGHTAPRDVNRPALEKFLRDQFHRNRPWSETVTRLIAAEGYEDVDGATNFLLAHVNNQAVPATAVTARVLLCEQVQCTQCHNHPFVDWTQDRFWQLNAFFQQTDIVRHKQVDPQTGARQRDRLELVSVQSGGPTFYEDRQSRMNVAYPTFDGTTVNPSSETNRRQELAKLLCSGDQPQVARAFVNRTWGKFFGYGFTNPIDDMGPHVQPVMPELLDRLTTEFVRSGYDVKQLVRWICLSEPYQMSSLRAGDGMVDEPESGQRPLFSRMYVKPLSAEQLFDSLLTATKADRVGLRYWDEVEQRRREWLEEFYTALDNDENAEEDQFRGSLAQTLVLMNGDLIRQATTPGEGTVLQQVLAQSISDDEKIRLLSLATLSRYPTPEELSSLRRLLRQQVQSRSREIPAAVALQEGFRDLMWAYLNSTEFRSIH